LGNTGEEGVIKLVNNVTDVEIFKNPEATGLFISHWLGMRFTIEYMGLWERMNNPDFNVAEFSNIKNESGSNGFVLSSKQWCENTNASNCTKASLFSCATPDHIKRISLFD
jgi:hypothetical protein